jgi:hypothetical protein
VVNERATRELPPQLPNTPNALGAVYMTVAAEVVIDANIVEDARVLARQ